MAASTPPATAAPAAAPAPIPLDELFAEVQPVAAAQSSADPLDQLHAETHLAPQQSAPSAPSPNAADPLAGFSIPPPPGSPPVDSDPSTSHNPFVPRPIEDLIIGGAKGVGSTVYGLGKIFHHIPGIGYLGDLGSKLTHTDPVAFEPGNPIEPALQAQGGWQKGGKFAEQVGEFFLPGGAVERGIQATRGLPLASRIGSAMWREALANAGVSYAQTGGDAGAAAASGITGGLLRGGLSSFGFLRDEKLARTVLDEAQEFGIPLTRAEQTQGQLRRLAEWMVRKSVGGSQRFAKFDLERNEMLRNVGNKIVDAIDPATMEPRAAGEYVNNALGQVKKIAGEELGAASNEILSKAEDVPLDLGKVNAKGVYEPGELSKAAQELIDSGEMEALQKFMGDSVGSVDDVSRAYAILRRFANPLQQATTATPALRDASGNLIPAAPEVRELTVGAARRLRTLLFDLTNSEASTVGKGALKQLNQALHKELVSTLERQGLHAEAEAFEAASTRYRQTTEYMEGDLVKQILKKTDAAAAPETLVPMLRGATGESAALQLGKVLSPAQMTKVRASVLKSMIEDSIHENGVFQAERFKDGLDKMDPNAADALFGSALRKQLVKFAEAAQRYRIVPGVKDMAEGGRMPLFAQLRLAAMGTEAARSAATGNVKELGAIAGLGALEAGGGALLARMMTSPSAVSDLTKALTLDPMSTLGKQAMARLAAYAAKEARRGSEISATLSPAQSKDIPEAHMTQEQIIRANPVLYPPDSPQWQSAIDAARKLDAKSPRRGNNYDQSADEDIPPDLREFGKLVDGKMVHERQDEFFSKPIYTLLPRRFQQTAKSTAAASWNDMPGPGQTIDDALAGAHHPRGHYGASLEEDPRTYGMGLDSSGVPRVPIAEMDRNAEFRRRHAGADETEDAQKPLGTSPKTVLTDDNDAEDQMSRNPFVVLHEFGHGIWLHDLTPSERAAYDKLHDADASRERAVTWKASESGEGGEQHAPGVPGAVQRYATVGYGWHSFASTFASYVLDPKAFRAKYPKYARLFDEFAARGGRQSGAARSDAPAPALPPPPPPL